MPQLGIIGFERGGKTSLFNAVANAQHAHQVRFRRVLVVAKHARDPALARNPERHHHHPLLRLRRRLLFR